MGRMSYSEACDAGYDGPPPGWRGVPGCSDGFCGALDCRTCYGLGAIVGQCPDCDETLTASGGECPACLEARGEAEEMSDDTD